MPLCAKYSILSLYILFFITHSKCDSFDLIAGYLPKSDVSEHLKLDLDQRDFEDFLNKGNFSSASDIYVNGGNSMKSTKIRMADPLVKDFSKGAKVEQGAASGILVTNAEKGDKTLKLGVTSKCVGKFAQNGDETGCFKEDGGPLKIDGMEVGSQISVNLPFRTLTGFSIEAESKMKGQEMFEMYKAYYGVPDYADKFVKAALKGQDETKRVSVPMDFLGKEEIFRIECAKKGSAYWSVWMYVIREMEDAVNDCKSGCEFCNNAPVHAWDEAVAFYTGSLEGKSGDESGKFLYRLAEKRCKNYRTCDGGVSRVNQEILKKFSDGKRKFDQGKCDEVHPIKKEIINLMSIPLIQGTLRYAYKIARGEGSPKEKAEGVAFLGAIIPRLYSCSHTDADTVRQHMWIDGDMKASKDGFKTVKEAFQRNYACMGLKCADIGGHLDDLTDDYSKDFRPCTDGSVPSGQTKMTPVWITSIMVFVTLAYLDFGCH
eukprot:GFUD01014287.1.p1 GENE.GFUD01014287.1~~GFUD01014287.1.p1  ORF type:complete len:487 (-),score=113.39 GFUD01014287.1:213-1673(-)